MRKENNASQKPAQSRNVLPVLRENVAGIDIGSKQHWVCGPVREDGTNVRVFGTTTAQLKALADWLADEGVESVAMESTHVYWIPVYELLASRGLEVLLVNARNVRNVPGRKTDMQDCQWIQVLHSCGLLKGSYRPADSICRLRALQRQLTNLIAQRSRHVQWMQKSLDQMNVQVHRAVTDLTGATGMAIVRAIASGERDPARLAALRDKRCKKSAAEIAEYLTGSWRDEHIFNLTMTLQLYDHLQEAIDDYERRIGLELEALHEAERKDEQPPDHPNATKQGQMRKLGDLELRSSLWKFAGADLTRIDGISARAAAVILTEVGPDLSQFPTEKHFVSWLRLSPRVSISGGRPVPKKRANGTGANRVAAALRMGAVSLQRSQTAIGAAYRRIARRKGAKVAVFASARKLATLVYRSLRYGSDYVDIGAQAYEKQYARQRIRALDALVRQLGFQIVPNTG